MVCIPNLETADSGMSKDQTVFTRILEWLIWAPLPKACSQRKQEEQKKKNQQF